MLLGSQCGKFMPACPRLCTEVHQGGAFLSTHSATLALFCRGSRTLFCRGCRALVCRGSRALPNRPCLAGERSHSSSCPWVSMLVGATTQHSYTHSADHIVQHNSHVSTTVTVCACVCPSCPTESLTLPTPSHMASCGRSLTAWIGGPPGVVLRVVLPLRLSDQLNSWRGPWQGERWRGGGGGGGGKGGGGGGEVGWQQERAEEECVSVLKPLRRLALFALWKRGRGLLVF